MKSPVDYFESARAADTVKRALGERLVPHVSEWVNERQHVYEFQYGGRLYRILPFFGDDSKAFNCFKLLVKPGTASDYAWVWHSGSEAREPAQYANVNAAAASANEHARKHGVL